MFTRNNIGERIGFFRRLHNLDKEELGRLLGYRDRTCDVRVAQYESGDRVPKEEMLKKIAAIFGISPYALNIPNIRTWASRMHIFFAMEDKYGAEIKKIDDEYYLRIEKTYPEHPTITGVRNAVLQEWVDLYSALLKGVISREEYDRWRYNYPLQGEYGYITFGRDDEEEVATYPEKYFSLLNLQQDVQNLADEKQEIDEETITDLEARYKDAERIISQELAELRRAIEMAKQSK